MEIKFARPTDGVGIARKPQLRPSRNNHVAGGTAPTRAPESQRPRLEQVFTKRLVSLSLSLLTSFSAYYTWLSLHAASVPTSRSRSNEKGVAIAQLCVLQRRHTAHRPDRWLTPPPSLTAHPRRQRVWVFDVPDKAAAARRRIAERKTLHRLDLKRCTWNWAASLEIPAPFRWERPRNRPVNVTVGAGRALGTSPDRFDREVFLLFFAKK